MSNIHKAEWPLVAGLSGQVWMVGVVLQGMLCVSVIKCTIGPWETGDSHIMATTLEVEVLRNMALVMEREREKRGMTVTELARLCELSESDYLGILDGSVNLRLSAIDRISNNLRIRLDELIGGQSRRLNVN